jgi:hypothetical protein
VNRESLPGLLSLILSLGLLGGLALVLCAVFLTPGKGILVPALLLLALTILVLRTGSGLDFTSRFLASFGTFAIAGALLYGFTAMAAATSVPFSGHLWRWGALAVVAAGASALVALASDTKERTTAS